ncbi:MAG: hypothetical protein NWF09_08075 [Candidatus Bathyarchaeota archaeon]|nr:hypothetical protein [Candidatus Bathyarchaeota archaeon]
MSEDELPPSKSFKEIIAEKQKKGKTRKKLMKLLTSLNSSVIYCFLFLCPFATASIVFYYVALPDILLWALFLVVIAIVCSITAQYLTRAIKKRQWRYAQY